jgi:hypothetical protein
LWHRSNEKSNSDFLIATILQSLLTK